MNKKLFATGIAALSLAFAAGPALAQSSDLNSWVKAGDVRIDTAFAATLTTAAELSGELPLSTGSALLFNELEPALALPAGTLPGDTYEGSGLSLSFNAIAGTTVAFSWHLSTVDYDVGFEDRAFAVIDSSTVSFATVAANAVSGTFTHTFSSSGTHSMAFGVLDVNDVTGVSTLTISNFNVSAVPEPASVGMWLFGLAGTAWFARRRAAIC